MTRAEVHGGFEDILSLATPVLRPVRAAVRAQACLESPAVRAWLLAAIGERRQNAPTA